MLCRVLEPASAWPSFISFTTYEGTEMASFCNPSSGKPEISSHGYKSTVLGALEK